MERPSSLIAPPSARSNPETTSKSVDLPAPFGPIKAVIDPRSTARLAPSIARTPPYRFSTPSTSRMASLTEQHLLLRAENSLRPKGHQQDEHEPDDDEADRRHLVRRERQLDVARALEHRHQDHGAEDHADVAPEAAENHDHEAEDREDRVEFVRHEQRQVQREHEAGDRSERGRERERLQLVRERVLAESARRVLVLADCSQHAAPRRSDDERDEQREYEQHAPAHEQQREQEARDVDAVTVEPVAEA